MCEQVLWEETKHLMAFVKGGVVPRIYEYRGIQYPVWERANYPHNVWLISKEELDENVNHLGSYPDKIADVNGYYIYGFTYDRAIAGQARGEFYRYLANRRRTDREWKVFTPEFVEAVQANVSMQNEPQKSSVPKSAASARPVVKNEKQAENPDIATSKKIILDNFEKFKKAYKARYEKEFLGSDDQTMFFRNNDDLNRILYLIDHARNRQQLIDPVNFYELCLGNPETADIIILGKNPGAGGIDTPKTDKEMQELLDELEQRKDCIKKNQFFPLSTLEGMETRPWFPSRLIFGHIRKENGRDILPPESCPKEGILSKFIKTSEDACHYADRICSLDLVPYHTVDFTYGEDLIREFGIDKTSKSYIKNAMDNKKIILVPCSSTLYDVWCKFFPDLPWKTYPYVFTSHKSLANQLAGQKTSRDGSLNINKLRHYSKIRLPRTPDENCEPLFKRLVELGWKRIKK